MGRQKGRANARTPADSAETSTDSRAPGAVAVPGPAGNRNEDDDNDDSTSFHDGGTSRLPGSSTELAVQAYAVENEQDDAEREEQIRRTIIASAAEAQVVSVGDPKGRRIGLLVVVVVVVAAAIAIGVAVPLTTSGTTSGPDEDVLASLRYHELQGEAGGYSTSIAAETRGSGLFNGSTTSSGSVSVVICTVKPCVENDGSCVVGADGFYEPGCCLGTECPDETKCRERCPNPPDSCFLTNPSNPACTRSSCYTCNLVEGQAIYELNDYVFAIGCLNVGAAVRSSNGETYKWAIFCGPVAEGAVVEENRDFGEYQCAAARLGAGFSDEDDGLLGSSAPCHFLQLLECGCGPSDMYTFGLPNPTGPCLPGGDCPILCEDAGIAHAKNLCRAFPGDIVWWEGQNNASFNFFTENVLSDKYELDIYIKG